jgi:hypothetical protein
VDAAQNILIKKLGFLVNQEIMTDSLDRSIQMFKEGLSEEQAHLITDLFDEQGRLRSC